MLGFLRGRWLSWLCVPSPAGVSFPSFLPPGGFSRWAGCVLFLWGGWFRVLTVVGSSASRSLVSLWVGCVFVSCGFLLCTLSFPLPCVVFFPLCGRHGGGMSIGSTPSPGPFFTPADAALVGQLEDLICTLWLYTGHYAWKQLTTEQRELFADVLDRRPQDDGDFEPVDRWWR